jgi:ABC-2 type transport system permease protein
MPSSPSLHLAARLAVAGLFGLLIGVGLVVIGAVFGGVRMPTASWAALLAIIAASALPFGAIGFGLGQLLGPNSAAGVINAVYLPMSFLSGLWVPIAFLPAFLQRLAVVFPPYHAAQLALTAIGAPHQESVGMALGSLVLLTVIATGFASFAARRADSRTWG